MKILLTTLLTTLLIITQPIIANEELDMSNLGNKLAVCSAKSLLLSAVMKDEKKSSNAFLKKSLKWRMASIVTLMTEDGMKQEDAKNTFEKVVGDTALNSGIKEAINNKPELIKLSEEIIFYLYKNCTPYDDYVDKMRTI